MGLEIPSTFLVQFPKPPTTPLHPSGRGHSELLKLIHVYVVFKYQE